MLNGADGMTRFADMRRDLAALSSTGRPTAVRLVRLRPRGFIDILQLGLLDAIAF